MLKLPRAARPIQTAAVPTEEDDQFARLEAAIAGLTAARAKLQRAAELEAEARRLRAEAGESSGATVDTDATVHDMNVDTRGKSEAVKRAAGRATRKHPAQEAFYKANVTIGEVAALLGEGRPRVSSWMAEGEANRPIPRRHVFTLKKRYGIPERSWLRIKD